MVGFLPLAVWFTSCCIDRLPLFSVLGPSGGEEAQAVRLPFDPTNYSDHRSDLVLAFTLHSTRPTIAQPLCPYLLLLSPSPTTHHRSRARKQTN